MAAEYNMEETIFYQKLLTSEVIKYFVRLLSFEGFNLMIGELNYMDIMGL